MTLTVLNDGRGPRTHAIVIGIGGNEHLKGGTGTPLPNLLQYGNLGQLTSPPRSALAVADALLRAGRGQRQPNQDDHTRDVRPSQVRPTPQADSPRPLNTESLRLGQTPSRLFSNLGNDESGNRVKLFTGTLWTTYEYVFAGSVEYGFGEIPEPRLDGQMHSRLNRVAVVIHSRVTDEPMRSDDAEKLIEELRVSGTEQALVFVNCDDMDPPIVYPYRMVIWPEGYCDIPQGLSGIAHNVLIATNVYLDHVQLLRWEYVNYLLPI
jgi:hypothetical protein